MHKSEFCNLAPAMQAQYLVNLPFEEFFSIVFRATCKKYTNMNCIYFVSLSYLILFLYTLVQNLQAICFFKSCAKQKS